VQPPKVRRQEPVRGEAEHVLSSLLRIHRRRLGLTQLTLAQRSAVSLRTIRDLETGRARARAQTVRLLADALGLDGLLREAFLVARGGKQVEEPPAHVLHTVPPYSLGALHGREGDVGAIVRSLANGSRRTASLSGLGGVGKTQIALEVARRLHTQRKWPVLWVTASQAGDAITDTLAGDIRSLATTGTVPAARLRRLLAAHDALVVLDGVDNLVPPGQQAIHELLMSCPGVRLISTSRGLYALPGANARAVAPLPTPTDDHIAGGLTELTCVPSVRLLTDRMTEADPVGAFPPADAAAIATLCRRLDGLPFALEVAAQKSVVLTIQELAALPSRDLLALSPTASTGQAASISDVISNSCDQLAEPDLGRLRFLAASADAWTVQDATDMLGETSAEVVDALGTLYRLGLVRRHNAKGPARFEVLRLVRAFLGASDDTVTSRVGGVTR
jgi:transcriptional regulator with XRE-family HTH domain